MELQENCHADCQLAGHDEIAADTLNRNIDSANDFTPEKKQRKPRRTAKEMKAEYEEFKSYYDQGLPILEICHVMRLTKAQSESYLSKISLEINNQSRKYGVCEGHSLPDSIRNILGGTRKSLYKFCVADGGVLISLHLPSNIHE